jgi:dienelactone hydrolase
MGGEIDSAGVIAALRRDLPKHGWSSLTVALDYPFKPNIFLIENEPLVSIEPTEVADEEAQVNPSEAEASQSEAAVSDEDEKTEVDTSNQANAEQESATNVEQEKPQALPPISNQQRIGAALSFLELKDIKRIIFIGYGAGGDVALQLLETITRPISGLVLIGTPSFPDEPSFKQFEFPILDIYGEQDLAAVEKAVKQRKLLMKRAGNELYQIRKVSGANHQFLGLEPTLARIVNGWLRTEYIEQGDN